MDPQVAVHWGFEPHAHIPNGEINTFKSTLTYQF